MEDRNWKSVHWEIRIYSLFLSFTFLIAVWIVLGLVKYHLYGLAGWDMYWKIKSPSFWLQASTFVRLHLKPYAFFIIVGIAADFFCWPYFMKKENSLKFE